MTPGGVPVELSDDFNDFYRVIRGTDGGRLVARGLDARCAPVYIGFPNG